MGPGSRVTRFLVVRHGETEWNRTGRFQGHADSPLTPRGVRQAEATRDALRGERIDACVSSDLARAMRTAKIVAQPHGLAVQADARLRERRYGRFEGRTEDEIRLDDPEAWSVHARGDPDVEVAGGESATSLQGRVVACIEETATRHAGGSVLLVGHGGVVGVVFRLTVGLELSAPRRYGLENGGVAVIEVGEVWRLVAWNAFPFAR